MIEISRIKSKKVYCSMPRKIVEQITGLALNHQKTFEYQLQKKYLERKYHLAA